MDAFNQQNETSQLPVAGTGEDRSGTNFVPEYKIQSVWRDGRDD